MFSYNTESASSSLLPSSSLMTGYQSISTLDRRSSPMPPDPHYNYISDDTVGIWDGYLPLVRIKVVSDSCSDCLDSSEKAHRNFVVALFLFRWCTLATFRLVVTDTSIPMRAACYTKGRHPQFRPTLVERMWSGGRAILSTLYTGLSCFHFDINFHAAREIVLRIPILQDGSSVHHYQTVGVCADCVGSSQTTEPFRSSAAMGSPVAPLVADIPATVQQPPK